MPTLADVVRDARKNKKWTQEKLAEEIGVNPGYIGQIEAGIVKLPSADRLELLEQKLGLSRADMLRAAGLLGPEEGIDLLAEFRRIAHLPSDDAKKQALRQLPEEVRTALELLALEAQRLSLERLLQ